LTSLTDSTITTGILIFLAVLCGGLLMVNILFSLSLCVALDYANYTFLY